MPEATRRLSPHADDLPRLPPPRDPWAVAALDLPGYLARAGLPGAGALPPTAGTLRAVHAAHLAAFPFENLDIMLGRGIRVDLESIQAKLVGGRRGGYCFEHGQLLAAALERLGFTVERLLARVWRPDKVGARTHLTLRVTDAGGRAWLTDAGFGSSPAGPVALDGDGPRAISGWTYDIAPAGRPGAWELRELRAGEWVTMYTVEEAATYPVDIEMGNHYTSTYPESWFTHIPIVARRDPGAVRSLLGRTYTITRPGHEKERRDLTDAEWKKTVTGEFGLGFTAGELDRLVATADGG
jgi:N-hydroxyarylamine O-acetyltransferase